MQARRKLRTVHRDGYGNTLDSTLKCNGLDLLDRATATASKPSAPRGAYRNVKDRYALMSGNQRTMYLAFRARQRKLRASKAVA